MLSCVPSEQRRPPYDDVDIMLFSHGAVSCGLANAGTGQRIDGQAPARRLLGVNPKAFPADFPIFAGYTSALRSLPEPTCHGHPWICRTPSPASAARSASP